MWRSTKCYWMSVGTIHLFILALLVPSPALAFPYKVVSMTDWGTVRVPVGERVVRVQLADIDASERDRLSGGG